MVNVWNYQLNYVYWYSKIIDIPMKTPKIRQMLKNEALNKIRRVFDKNRSFGIISPDETTSEIRELEVYRILNELETELSKLK